MLDILGEVVEQDVAQSPAQHDAEHRPGDEIIQQDRRQRALAAGGEAAGVTPADQYADDIGERIPADGEGADGDQHGIDGGEGQDIEHRAVIGAARDSGKAQCLASRGWQ